MSQYDVTDNGYFGRYGGSYIPEILQKCVEELKKNYRKVIDSEDFKQEFAELLRDYVGRPSPLYLSKNLSKLHGCKIYLKREDLNHTGAHKINNAIGQILLARRMGKSRIVAETGAGQHGVATATVCALMGMPCIIYMGALDVKRQRPNVEKMKLLGAEVVAVESGNQTLKDACNEAIRDWCCHPEDTFYLIGSTMGPHPYPDLVARLQSVISAEIRKQLQEKEGRPTPDYLVACIGGGSNAAGTIFNFLDDKDVKIVYAEAGGKGVDSGMTAATLNIGETGKAQALAINDDEALAAAYELNRLDGILPALESAHALGALHRLKFKPTDIVVLTLSGRGDKDMDTYLKYAPQYMTK